LGCAFDLKLVGTHGLACALLELADRFVGQTRDFVRRATHFNSPGEVEGGLYAALIG
jgi:hypothetical protein